MKDFDTASWEKIERKFAEKLGSERVSLDDKGIHLRFNLTDKVQMDEFNQMGVLGFETGVFSRIKEFSDPSKTVMEIPKEQLSMAAVVVMAERLAAHAEQVKPGEMARRIQPNEPEHALVALTGVPWNHVTGSPYEGHIVEAVLPEGAIARRDKQEYGVGIALRKEGPARMEINEWLDHQKEVEGKGATEPRTALPADWVTRTAVDRIKTMEADDPLRVSLPKVFSKG
jgi:hypothetical protein